MKLFGFVFLCAVACCGCAQFDQYMARSAASRERVVAAERAEVRPSAAHHGTTVRRINACEEERCIGNGRICVNGVLDADMDGSPAAACGGPDCRDDDPAISPNRPEVCDGFDNDCDGAIDENCVSGG